MTLKTSSIFFLLSLGVSPLLFTAHARKPDNKIIYDFGHSAMLVYGIYTPEEGSKKSGLQAEIDARKDGVALAAEHLSQTCKKGDKASVDPNGSWRHGIRSLGSTIYPKGKLEIELNVPLRIVFPALKTSNLVAPTTPDEEEIAFKLPWIPAHATKCATIKIAQDSKTSWQVLPVNTSRSDSKYKVVTLSLGADLSLQPATPADALALQNSTFAKLANDKFKGTVESPIPVPVVDTGRLE